MIDFLKTIIVTFSIFTKIPMPQFEWTKKNMEYIMLIFPFVGLAVGFVNIGIFIITKNLGFSNVFSSIILVITPMIVTGGIHLDGYCDTIDALSSYQEKHRKLEILSDPHIGAFGVLALFMYIILFTAIMIEIEKTNEFLIFIAAIPFIARCFSAYGVVTVNSAKEQGSLKTFRDTANSKLISFIITFFTCLALTLLFFIDRYLTLTIFSLNILIYFRWLLMIRKGFGGITGDLSGYLTQKLEIYMFLAILLVQKIGVLL